MKEKKYFEKEDNDLSQNLRQEGKQSHRDKKISKTRIEV